jgi:hypothetical protein
MSIDTALKMARQGAYDLVSLSGQDEADIEMLETAWPEE